MLHSTNCLTLCYKDSLIQSFLILTVSPSFKNILLMFLVRNFKISWRKTWKWPTVFVSVQFSCSFMSNSLWPLRLQHSRLPCPSPTPGTYQNSCPLSQWFHPAISSSVVPFSSCPQSLPASGSFLKSQLFEWGGQSIGAPILYIQATQQGHDRVTEIWSEGSDLYPLCINWW